MITAVNTLAKHRQFNEPNQELEGYKRPLKGIFIFVCFVGLLGLFLFWRLEGTRAEKFRSDVIDLLVPTIEFGKIPSDIYFTTLEFVGNLSSYQDSQSNIATLEDDLKRWKAYALSLEEENTMLRKLVNFTTSEDYSTITADVLVDTTSPFSHTVLLASGTENGVEIGYPGTDGSSIVGRVINVSRNTSRLLLITDSASRIPVRVLPSGNRGIVVGDNSAFPQIDLINNSAEIEAGDQIITDGSGGIFPPDFTIGTLLKGSKGDLRVLLSTDFSNLQNVNLIIIEKAIIDEQGVDIVLNPENSSEFGGQ